MRPPPFSFRFRIQLSHWLIFAACLAPNAWRVSAATFAPTPAELSVQGNRLPDAPLDLSALAVQVDSKGRRSYVLDDRRYLADAVQIDSAFAGNLWPAGHVYYQFDSGISTANRAIWRGAAATWSAAAGVTFTESTGNGNYIYVQNSAGNDSYVGMTGGSQEMNIHDWLQYIIAHEIGHALGLEHEQSRSDRDSYVLIYLNNVESGQAYNFDRIPNTINYGSYDFDSIMHYWRLAFSSNGQNTIVPRPAYTSHLYTMGMAESLSALDRAGMAQRYPHSAFIANDLFANRIAISGTTGTLTGTNSGAGKEAGEPNHFGNVGGASVWYKWTAAQSGLVNLDTFGSTFDTLLAVYTGSAVAGLTPIAANDDSNGTTQSSVSFSATAGVSYQIAVDGYNGASGQIQLTWAAQGSSKKDFNGDHKADLIWQNKVTGGRALWLMNGTALISGPTLPVVAKQWQIVGLGDFNGDTKTDIVWQNTATGQGAIWLMNGTSLLSTAYLAAVSPQWEVTGTGDFNNDGQDDIVVQNNTTGERRVWLMTGVLKSGEFVLPTVSPQWRIVAVDDFNSDGHPDLVWQHITTGQHSVWLMDQASRIGDSLLPALAPQWQIAGTGDFNQDGKADVLWQNSSTGQRSIWFMNGTTWAGSASLPTVSPDWQIRNH